MGRWCRLAAAATLFLAGSAAAADKTWDNGTANFTWDTTSLNWTGAAWSNAGDSANFGGAGTGTITVPGPINVGSINVTGGAYTLAGAGSLTIAPAATGTLVPSTILVDAAAGPFAINVPLASSIGLYKDGGGTLQLGAPVTFTGTTPILNDAVNLQIGLTNSGGGGFPIGGAGTVELTAANVLPATSSVAIGNGWLNIGSFNTTLGRLVYMNTVASGPHEPEGNNGVYGTGTLKVTGPIVSQYNLGNFGISNTLAANLDMNGGTQQFILNTIQTQSGYTALHVTGVLSNGSLLKSWTGPQPGGIGLYANNTYTGATTFNGPTFGGLLGGGASGNVVAGTNASTSLNVVNGFVTLFGADGSYGAATAVNVVAGSVLALDNNGFTNGTNAPAIAAGNNGNRLNDAAAVILSGGAVRLISPSGGAASETYGTLNAARGFNQVVATATGAGGSAALTASGAWTQGARALTQFTGTSLGTSSLIKFASTPAAVGGLIPRAYGNNTSPAETGFVKYDATNGVVLLAPADYQTAFGSGGNVSLAANPAAPIGSETINSLRYTATANGTVSFNPGSTLTVTSGMIMTTAANLTFDATTPNGTLAFGAAPGTFVALSTINVNSPITGTAGLIKAGGSTLNLSGSLAGLSGPLTHTNGTTQLNVPYAGDIDVVAGALNLRASLTTPGQTITLGNPDTPANTIGSGGIGLNVQFTSPAAAATTIAANLVVTNGLVANPTSSTVTINQQSGTAGLVQEFSGSVALNSQLNVQGGGNTTNTILFSGPISGPGSFRVTNGTVRFTSTATNHNGPYILGNGGNTSLVTFDGANASTTGTMTIGFGTGLVTSTRVRLSVPNAIPGGQITMLGGTLQPTASMTLPNAIHFSGNPPPITTPSPGAVDIGTGLAVNLSGPLTSDGLFTLSKVGTGKLTLTGNSPANAANFAVAAGTLAVNANVSAGVVTVASGGTLQGTGTLTAPVTVSGGGTLKGGDSIGVLTLGDDVSLAATSTGGAIFRVEGDPTSHSGVVVTGATNTIDLVGLTGANLFTIRIDGPTLVPGTPYSWELARTQDNALGLLVNGVAGTGASIPTTNYAITSPDFPVFTNTNLVANGNSLVLSFTPSAVPEPGTLLLGAAAAAGFGWRWRRRAATK